tara:strand:- start:4662 stop:4871 length:210 start_codon:yes stop_codon:yes gene_type:complete
MANIKTKHDSIVLINRELRTTIKMLGAIKYEAEIQGKRDTDAYQLLNEYQKKLMDMHNDLLDLVSYPEL